MSGFKNADKKDIAFFESLCNNRVFTGDSIKDEYSHDEMKLYGRYKPEAVVEAETAQEISQILKYCNDNNIAVTPRGSGTGLCGGCVPVLGGIVVSTIRMNKIIEIDKKTMTATVESGLLLMDLIAKVDESDLFYPPDPGEKSATIGGNVMTNAGGMRAVRFGVTRDYIRGLEVSLADGTILTLGGKLAKNSSGYSLKDLIIGSEGTLAFITKIILKLLPKQGGGQSMLVPFPNIEQAIVAAPYVVGSALAPTAVEFMQKEIVVLVKEYLGRSFPDTNYPSYLLVSIDADSEDEVLRKSYELAELLISLGAEDVFFADTDERKDSLWIPRGAFLEAIKSSTIDLDECDVVVPIDKVAPFIDYVNELRDKTGIRINYFGHAGDGNIHVYICYDGGDRRQWDKKCAEIMSEMYDRAADLGGQLSGEHGIGHAKTKYLIDFAGERQIELMKGVKKVFDPNGILNPGKIFHNKI